jgi:hypothetical protein
MSARWNAPISVSTFSTPMSVAFAETADREGFEEGDELEAVAIRCWIEEDGEPNTEVLVRRSRAGDFSQSFWFALDQVML